MGLLKMIIIVIIKLIKFPVKIYQCDLREENVVLDIVFLNLYHMVLLLNYIYMNLRDKLYFALCLFPVHMNHTYIQTYQEKFSLLGGVDGSV